MKVLIIEDDIGVREYLSRALFEKNIEVEEAEDENAAEQLLRKKVLKYDALITDLILPGGKGGEFLVAQLRKKGIQIPIIVLSGTPDRSARARVLKLGADDFIKKPFSINELIVRLQSAVAKRTSSSAAV